MTPTQEIDAMTQTPDTALVRMDSGALTAGEMRAQVNRIQEVMREVMKEGEHYGKIPGTPKPSLWQAGAEKLALTFHIAIDSTIEADLSSVDAVCYRVRAVATSQASGLFLGAGMGECSSNEEKYKWRQAVCKAEWDETPVDRRRSKWRRDGTSVQQIRTEPADIANTVLKMAVKRAKVAAILQVTAASDIFTQDIEDLPETLAPVEPEKAEKPNGNGKAAAPPPPPPAPTGPPANVISEAQAKRFFAIWKGRSAAGWTEERIGKLLAEHGIANDRAIPRHYYDAICKTIERQTWDEYCDQRTNP
jgi:hypothetical protein